MNGKIKVVCIVGARRSGSTLLDILLGSLEGFLSCGELRLFWRDSLDKNVPCSCEETVTECDFWRSVIEKSFGSKDAIELGRTIDSQERIDRLRSLLTIYNPFKTKPFQEEYDSFFNGLSRLYTGIAATAPSKTIVDSSKDPSYAILLAQLHQLDIHIVHLVRDPRAVAHSWTRRKKKYEHKQTVYMPTKPVTTSSLHWMKVNVASECIRTAGNSYTRVRYEDFVEHPEKSVRKIGDALGDMVNFTPEISENMINLGTNHLVMGNPVRFQTGQLKLRYDDAWEQNMTSSDQMLVTGLTAPFLVRYGYNIRPSIPSTCS